MGAGGSTTLASDAVTPVAAPVVAEPPVEDPPAVAPVVEPPVIAPVSAGPREPAAAVVPAPPPAIAAPAPPATPRAAAPSLPLPRITGRARVGQTLRCAVTGKGRFSWTRNGKAIRGARSTRYRLRRADTGRRIACRVTIGRTTRSSRPTGRVARR
jgi:hypothetical protein